MPQRAYTDAVLGVYELNDTALLKDIFLWAYERSAAQYAAVRQSLGEPDPFRLKYRSEIRDAVAHIIRSKLGRSEAARQIEKLAAGGIAIEDREVFTTVVADELLGLHEGNFARFQVRSSEFQEWRSIWTQE